MKGSAPRFGLRVRGVTRQESSLRLAAIQPRPTPRVPFRLDAGATVSRLMAATLFSKVWDAHTVRTLANDVVIGLMAATLQR